MTRVGNGRNCRWRRALAVAGTALAAGLVLGPAAPAAGQEPTAPAAGESAAIDAIDSLLAAGRLQEAAWAAREAGDRERADSLLGRLAALLTAAPDSANPLGMDSQGVSFTFRLHHAGGVQSIFKVDGSDIFCPDCGAGREIATYRIDRLLGLELTPMTVPARIVDADGDTLTGSAMYFVHGAATPAEAGAEKPDALRFFDAVTGNSDRHTTNWLVLRDGRPVAIDHNRAFQYRPPARSKTCWETEIDSIARPADLGEPLERYRDLTDEELAEAARDAGPELAERFVAMRERILARLDARVREPDAELPLEDCLVSGG